MTPTAFGECRAAPRARGPGIAAFGLIRVLEPEGLPGIREDAVGVIDQGGDRITAQYRVGRAPDAVASGAGSVWVASQLDGTVSRLDGPHEPVVTIPVGGDPDALAFGAGSLWVADGDGRDVAAGRSRLQPGPAADPGRERAEVAGGGGGALWVVSGADGSVRRIDLAARRGRSASVRRRPRSRPAPERSG